MKPAPTLPELWAAMQRTLRGQGRTLAGARFWLDADTEFVTLRDELAQQRWRPSASVRLVVRDPKRRVISVPALRDRVVHQWLAPWLEPAHERRFIADTYACRAGRGLHAALRKATAWARTHRWFVRLDVERYFPSIDHERALGQLQRDVREPWVHDLVRLMLATGDCERHRVHLPGDDLFAPTARAVGLPLGSLVSQLVANRYLDPVDHLAKDRRRLRAYLRYMDDMFLFAHDRAELEEHAHALEEACWGLRLRLHRWEILPTAGGVGALGYRILPTQVRVKATSVRRATWRLARKAEAVRRGDLSKEQWEESLLATFAHWEHADSFQLRERTLRKLGLFQETEDRSATRRGRPLRRP